MWSRVHVQPRAGPFAGRHTLEHWPQAVGVVGFITHVTQHQVLRVLVTFAHLCVGVCVRERESARARAHACVRVLVLLTPHPDTIGPGTVDCTDMTPTKKSVAVARRNGACTHPPTHILSAACAVSFYL